MKNYYSLAILSVFLIFTSCSGRRPEPTIKGTLESNIGLFKACYGKFDNFAADGTPSEGELALVFTVDPSGKVEKAGVEEDSTINEDVQKCVVHELTNIKFPESDSPTHVRQNLKFSKK